MSTLVPDRSSCYITGYALRLVGFPEDRIHRALRVLFPDPDQDDTPLDRPEILGDYLEPCEPTPEDLADYAAWSEALERQRDRDDAMTWEAMRDAVHERRRFKEEELIFCGLAIG